MFGLWSLAGPISKACEGFFVPAIGDKMSWDTLPKTGLFDVLLTSKGGNIAFLPPSSPCNVVPMFELPIENSKHPNFEWRGHG